MATDKLLSFGALLKLYRRAAEISQEQLAERAGYSAVYVRKLEGGARRPTSSTIELLAHALGLGQIELVELQLAAQRMSASDAEISDLPDSRSETGMRIVDIHTFLIADIRGYTRFTQERGDEAAARLTTTFAALAREIIAEAGGEVIELRGDEVLAVFASARGGLRAAIALRDRCREASEAEPALPLHAGIGLDAGEAVPVEGGYRGGALNLAARLCSLAGAFEIFASETVVGLARKVENLAYRERGRILLKGYEEPVSVVQVLPEAELETLSRRETFDAVVVAGSDDRDVVEGMAARLRDSGLKVWSAEREAVDLTGALRLTGCALVVFGRSGVDESRRNELAAALNPLGEEWRPRVLLVLLPGVSDPIDPETLPSFLSTRVWLDLRERDVTGADVTAQLVHIVEGGVSAADRPTKVMVDQQPYRGLEAFDEDSSQFFFGRDADIQRLIERLKATNFLAVLGPSGSGKSSLVQAGLLPALRSAALSGSDSWTLRTFAPGARPLTALAAQLLRLYPKSTMQQTLDQMGRDSRSLHLATVLGMADRAADDRIVWVIDQFEEVFTLCNDEQERQQFLANLLHAASVPDSRTIVVLTMRADFYHRCAQYPELAAWIAANQYLVAPLDRDGLRQVVEEPAWRVGLEFEQGLVDRILEDVANQPGSLPLLEYALLELWERRESHILTLDGYRESGGVQGAIAKRAEATFSHFSGEEQAIARQILLRLTQTGEGTADTRRRAAMVELVTLTGSAGTVERVVNALVDARLLTAGRDDVVEERQIEVSHEALIRGWPRLRRWIDEDRAGLRVHRRLTEAAQEWLRLQKDQSALYRGATLAVALEWADRNPDALNELEREFVDSSTALQRQEQLTARRRIWLAAGGLIAALIVISAAAVFAFVQRQAAVRDRDAAVSAYLAQQALAKLLTDRELSTILAVEAVRVSRTDAAVSALRHALARFPPYLLLQGHADAVSSAFYSPDSRRIVTASLDGTARIWDARSGRVVRVLHSGAVYDAQFSPDGGRIVTAQRDGTARIWNAGNGRELLVLSGHRKAVRSASFSPDGHWVVTASVDRTARLWNASSGRLEQTFRGHTYAVNWAAFNPSGTEIITASDDGTARIWDARTGRTVHVLDARRNRQQVTSASFSSDGRTALTTGFDGLVGSIRTWDVATGQSMHTWPAPTNDAVLFGSFSPDSLLIATANFDATERVWETGSGNTLAVLRAHTAQVNTAAFSPDNRWLVTASTDGTALIRTCDVCGSVDHLLALARQRVHRSLTPGERRHYLNQS